MYLSEMEGESVRVKVLPTAGLKQAIQCRICRCHKQCLHLLHQDASPLLFSPEDEVSHVFVRISAECY